MHDSKYILNNGAEEKKNYGKYYIQTVYQSINTQTTWNKCPHFKNIARCSKKKLWKKSYKQSKSVQPNIFVTRLVKKKAFLFLNINLKI